MLVKQLRMRVTKERDRFIDILLSKLVANLLGSLSTDKGMEDKITCKEVYRASEGTIKADRYL